MEHYIKGPCIKFGDSINTDVIIPARYLVSIDPKELGEHAFEPLGSTVQERLRSSEIVIAGKNFGCGSAREQAASCLIGAGIKTVIAKSYARVFYRNAINTGLPVIECPEAVQEITDGDDIVIDFQKGTIKVNSKVFSFEPYPENLQRILESGGLIAYLEKYVLKN